MSKELKYKVGDRVEVTNPECTNFGETGLVIQITHLGNWSYRLVLPNGEEAGWFGSEDLSRAASSPDEQDIENAGGSAPVKATAVCRCSEPPTARLNQSEPITRDATLDRAKSLINGDRAKDYGDAAENFQRIADLWKPILGKDVTAVAVSLCLLQLKVARIITSNGHEDSWIDAAGYVALGSEIAGGRK